MNKTQKLVEVYKAANDIEAQVIKSLLESYGIPSFLKINVSPAAFGSMMGGVKIMVLDSMADKARELIVSDKHV